MREDNYRRHDLVRVDPSAWTRELAARPDLGGVPYLSGWADAGWPLIVRRYVSGEARSLVPLGLPLPPVLGKRRIGLALPSDALAPVAPPSLAETRETAPSVWRTSLDAVVALGTELGLAPRPFGSLLWQHVTGLAYLSDTSDLDLLWPVPLPVPHALLDNLAALAASAPMRVDGELLLPDGAGIHWREVREAPEDGEVLAKSVEGLELRRAASLRERLAA